MDQLDKIESKLDKLDTRLDKVDVTLAKQCATLEEHVRRTNLLEQKLEPVEKHVLYMNGALKLVGVIAVIAGLTLTLKQLFF